VAKGRTPEESGYISIQKRINHKRSDLIPFGKTGIDYSLADYIQLVDGTGRAIIEGKRGNQWGQILS
jgi:hypothetical protein